MGAQVHPHLSLRHQNVLNMESKEKFDVVMAQGIFYLLGDNAESKMYRLIRKMFSLSTEALTICAISSWASEKSEGEFYVNPAALLNWCRKLTTCIVLRHDYLPNDVTLYLYRSKTNAGS